MKQYKYILLFLLLMSLYSCNNSTVIPKPRSYFRIDFPQKKYVNFESTYPFSFQIPEYTKIYVINNDSCWFNIYYPQNRATIYITYKQINNNLNSYLEEAREFVYKHCIKADAIEEQRFENDTADVYGILYNIKGNTASQLQFILTDSTKHFFRGSLYFDIAPNKDSLAPVIDFIQSDIIHLMESFKFH